MESAVSPAMRSAELWVARTVRFGATVMPLPSALCPLPSALSGVVLTIAPSHPSPDQRSWPGQEDEWTHAHAEHFPSGQAGGFPLSYSGMCLSNPVWAPLLIWPTRLERRGCHRCELSFGFP